MKKTVIEVTIETRNRLRSLGRKGESYNDIIKRLILVFERVQRKRLDEIKQRLNHGRLAGSRKGMET